MVFNRAHRRLGFWATRTAGPQIGLGRFAAVGGCDVVAPELGPDKVDAGRSLANCVGVLDGQRRPGSDLSEVPFRVVETARRKLLCLESLGAENREFLLHCALHHRYAGHDRDDRRDAGDDADQSEKGAQLVRADRLERH